MSSKHGQHRPDSTVSTQRAALDYLALGHVTLDRQADGGYLPGGTVLFSTVQAARLGLRAGIITAGRPEDLEGPLAPLPCASETRFRKCDECVDIETCGTRLVMKEVRDATAKILERTTLATVCQQVEEARTKLLSPHHGTPGAPT